MIEDPESKQLLESGSRNYICNFRAPDAVQYQVWQRLKAYCKDNGLDICRVVLAQSAAFLAAVDSSKSSSDPVVTALGQIINIYQTNTFVYSVDKPRREPYTLSCARTEFSRTISSLLHEAYVKDKARHLNGEFSFCDFKELPYDVFRRTVVKLKRKGFIVANPQRSIPQLYFLAEKLAEEKT